MSPATVTAAEGTNKARPSRGSSERDRAETAERGEQGGRHHQKPKRQELPGADLLSFASESDINENAINVDAPSTTQVASGNRHGLTITAAIVRAATSNVATCAGEVTCIANHAPSAGKSPVAPIAIGSELRIKQMSLRPWAYPIGIAAVVDAAAAFADADGAPSACHDLKPSQIT